MGLYALIICVMYSLFLNGFINAYSCHHTMYITKYTLKPYCSH